MAFYNHVRRNCTKVLKKIILAYWLIDYMPKEVIIRFGRVIQFNVRLEMSHVTSPNIIPCTMCREPNTTGQAKGRSTKG